MFIVNLSAVISFVKWQSEEKVKKANKKLQTTRKHRNVKKVISWSLCQIAVCLYSCRWLLSLLSCHL